MLLNELTGIKKFINLTHYEVLAYIEKEFNANKSNLKLLGTGVHGVAVQSGDTVYKFWMKDSAYHAFIEYCILRQDNKFLPKLKSAIKTLPAFFLRDKMAPDKIFYIKMEKLEPIINHDEKVENFNLFTNPKLTKKQIPFFKIVKMMGDYDTSNKEKLLAVLIKEFNSAKHTDYIINPDLLLAIETLFDIKQLQEANGFDDDLHGGNIMRRGNQLVIIDPLANPEDVELNDRFYRFTRNLISNKGKPQIGKYGVTKMEK